MALNGNIVDTEKPYGIYSPTFLVNDFSGLFLHPLVVYLFSMNGDNSNNKNHHHVLFFLIIFLLQDNAILLCLESLKQ